MFLKKSNVQRILPGVLKESISGSERIPPRMSKNLACDCASKFGRNPPELREKSNVQRVLSRILKESLTSSE